MNRLLTPLSNAIIDHNGTIDKYMGDAIMAFWNAPLDVPDHAGEACRAALDMRARLAGLNDTLRSEAERAGRSHVPIAIGIGINTGDCTVGNMGSDIRFDYSVLGDPVNLASRLEGQSKTYGVSILMGETTAAAVSDRFALVEIDLIRVKGKQEPQRVFALLDERTASRDAEFDSLAARFQRLHEAYRNRRWDAAQQALAGLRAARIPDDLIDFIEFMDKRISAFRALPPPEGWDGVHDAETK
jgi:adenylate cyclase